MACAPGTYADDFETREECTQSQIDEVALLQSMFPEPGRVQIIESLENGNDVYSLLLNAHVKIEGEKTVNAWASLDDEGTIEARETPPNTKPTFERSMSGRRWLTSFSVNYLTPISLHVILPPSYPLHSSPDFTLSCLWLSSAQLEVLCGQLDVLWGEAEHMPILYTWLDWLENNAFSHLALTDSVILTPHLELDDDGVTNPRAVTQCVDLETDIGIMLRHDLAETIAAFHQSNHECEICFDEKPGNECVFLNECRHSFCSECLREFISTNIREGTVQLLNCPNVDCKASLSPAVIQSLASEEEFERWERLLLQKTLDALGDIRWCPRCNSLSLADEQLELNLAICTECQFSFCTACRESWHQGTPCFHDTVKPKERETSVRGLTESDIKRFQQREKDRQSTAFIKLTSKTCPKCRVPIYKFEGCNKVVCTQCRTSICWMCGKKINGYDHFGRCPLFITNGDPRARPQVEREIPERAREIAVQLDIDPSAVKRLVPCPRCRQKSLKENRNNHLQCWACKTNFCAMCQKRIEGSLNQHYNASTNCVQHSDHFHS